MSQGCSTWGWRTGRPPCTTWRRRWSAAPLLAGPARTGRAQGDLAGASALLDGYQAVRPLCAAEAAALPAVFPVVHVEYALSEVEYFGSVVDSPGNVELAYDGYLLEHAAWFGTPDGAAVLDHLRRRARARGL